MIRTEIKVNNEIVEVFEGTHQDVIKHAIALFLSKNVAEVELALGDYDIEITIKRVEKHQEW